MATADLTDALRIVDGHVEQVILVDSLIAAISFSIISQTIIGRVASHED